MKRIKILLLIIAISSTIGCPVTGNKYYIGITVRNNTDYKIDVTEKSVSFDSNTYQVESRTEKYFSSVSVIYSLDEQPSDAFDSVTVKYSSTGKVILDLHGNELNNALKHANNTNLASCYTLEVTTNLVP